MNPKEKIPPLRNELSSWFDTPVVIKKTKELIDQLESVSISDIEAIEIAHRIKTYFLNKL